MNTHLRHAGFKAMGTYCEIQVFETSRVNAKRQIRRLIEEARRLESKYTRYRDDSFLSQINGSAGNQNGIRVDIETAKLFEHAQVCYEQSDGLFDITAGVLRRVWDFDLKQVPTESELQGLLPLIGYDRLTWQEDILFLPENMEIDFGGIVKEYAADSLAKLARELGVKRGLINLGGDFAAIGLQPEDKPWQISVSHPDNRAKAMAHINLHEGGLASSGDYERFFVLDGKRYSHLLNPKTGWPCAGLTAVSVAANLCTVAGSFATIAMLKPKKDALDWLRKSGLPFVFMDDAGHIGGPGLIG
ncbi:MAG: thiamine biosynthesis protein ApbE [Gammaproteobacteria bacterium]|nr:thiamine biosynthesis protein ApbE [Gammaproteobacteria bacterium]